MISDSPPKDIQKAFYFNIDNVKNLKHLGSLI